MTQSGPRRKDSPVICSAVPPTYSRVRAVVLALALLLATAACTGDPDPDRSAPSSSATTTPRTPTTQPSRQPASAPFRVRVTRVSGTLGNQARSTVARNVGRVLSAYVDAAFLRGPYPRSDFAGSFATFTPGAARTARRDQALLTNQRLGPSTESVRAVRRAAYLSVLAPYKVAAGITANIDLDLLVERSAGPPERVRVNGRLLLTRDRDGGWTIFGYDVSRSDTPARSGS
jgi:hypothetical protein